MHNPFVCLDDTVEESLVALQNQYEELDGLNQTWQSFYDNQMNLLQTKFNDYISFDDEANFDDIIHLIASKLEQQRQHEKNSTTLAGNRAGQGKRSFISLHCLATDASRENTDVLTERLTNSQTNEHLLKEQIFNLEEDCRRFEQQSNGHQKSIDELKTHLHLLSDENQQLKQDNTMLREENDVLISDTLALRSHAVQLQRQASPQNRTCIFSRYTFNTSICSFTIDHRFCQANQQSSNSSHAHRRSQINTSPCN